jgi:hypothetical protein
VNPALSGEPDQFQQLLEASRAVVEVCEQAKQLVQHQAVEEGDLLELDPDHPADSPGLPGHVDADHQDLTRLDRAQALDRLQDGVVTRTVGSQQAEHLAAVDVEADATHRFHVAV